MVIDFHTHIFPEKIAAKTIEQLEKRADVKAATDGTLQGLLASMERCGVDLSVILPVATKPSQFDSIQNFAKSVNEQYPGRLISFGGIHPDCADYKKELDTIHDMGFQGIKLHPDYQGVMIDDVRYMRIIEYASELGLIILPHAGTDIGLPEPVHCPPEKMRKVLDAIKPEKMVLAHFGGWGLWEDVYEYLAGENVWLDTAFIYDYITEEQFYKILEKHGPDRILFATDSPWSDMATGIDWINKLSLPQQIKEDILSGNAKRLLGLE
ncbi:MAG: amidohydrolase family protein [Lachnospiraceae bacterium]|nr:amidohydrolase family protein [Lachnospiraceae bacterium]